MNRTRERESVYFDAQLAFPPVARELYELSRTPDPNTAAHAERVARLAHRLAIAAGWSTDRAYLLYEAALVHDVGKAVVPQAILTADRQLTRGEWARVRRHPVASQRMAGGHLTREQAEWVLHHHERPDGLGYPDGLAGDQISRGSGLLALADAWDAMISPRPGQPAKDPEDALREVTRLSGEQFTSYAIDALRTLLRF